MGEYRVRQGDQYAIPFPILIRDTVITREMIDSTDPENAGDVEIIVGNLRKTYRDNQVKFNEMTYTFDFPLTQEETFKFRPGSVLQSQVRVRLVKINSDDMATIFSFDGPDIVVEAAMKGTQLLETN